MFRIGQEIVAIRSHSKGVFKRGDIFLVLGVSVPPCKCFDFLVDIGREATFKQMHCSKCDGVFEHNDTIYWFANENFVPIEKAGGFMTAAMEEKTAS